jgi:hypothetical protein
MPHYVKKLWEKFLLPLQNFFLFGRFVPGHTKTFKRGEAVAIGGLKLYTGQRRVLLVNDFRF